MCGACIAPAKGWPGIAVLPGAAHLPCEEYHSNVKLKIPNLLAESVILTRQPVASCLYKQALIKGAIDWNCFKIAYEMNVRACIGGRDWAIVLVGRLVKGTSSSGTNAWCGWCVSWGAWKTVFGINFAILRLLFKMRTNLSPLNKHFRGREATDERWKTYVFIVRSSRSCGLKNRKITLGLRKKKWPITHLYVLAFYRCWRFKHPSTAISRRTYPVSSAPGSQATSSPVSTWMGDRLGIRDAVGIGFCVFFFFLKISVNFVNENDDRDHYSHTTIFCSLGRRVIRCIS